jgi:hypothetical protein
MPCTLLSLLLAAAGLSPDAPNTAVAARAEAAFAQGLRLREDGAAARPHFRAAAEAYEELRRRGANGPSIYRNLGHAWLLAGELPRAILTYRQGLRLWPADRGLRADLTDARAEVVFPPYTNLGRAPGELHPPWWPRVGRGPLAAGAAVSYTLACVCLTRWRMTRRGRLLSMGLAALILAGVLTGFAAVEVRDADDAQSHPAVVIAEDGVLLRRGDGLRFPPRYETPVNRGVEGRLLFERGDWLQVELSGGEVGWVPRKYALIAVGERGASAG